MSSREQRAERVHQLLAARNLTRHAAHNRADISRPAMDKLWEGRDVELEIIERFARSLGQDVNEWRELWGYPRVEDEDPSGKVIYRAGLKALKEEFGRPIPVDHLDEEMTPTEAFRQLASLRDQLQRGVI